MAFRRGNDEAAEWTIGDFDGRADLRRKSSANALWGREPHDPKVNTVDPQSLPRRSFTPRSVQTLMTDGRLREHGLRILEEEARSWLVSLDSDTLVEDRQSDSWLPELAERIDELRAIAAEEGVPFSQESACAAIAFARSLNADRRPGAFVVGNGNIRVLWSNEQEQIGLQFKADGSVQYVMVARRAAGFSSHMGEDDCDGVLRHITAAGLRHLLGSR